MNLIHKKIPLSFALLATVTVLSTLVLGACQSPRQRVVTECGGPAKFACPQNMFCNLDSNCGGFDALGKCERIPHDCPEQNAKVCSCSDKTFSSACYAHASGESIAYKGECLEGKQ